MLTLSSTHADVQRRSRTDAELTTQIADFLASENNEDVCRLHVIQAEEIMAMVREAERLANTKAA